MANGIPNRIGTGLDLKLRRIASGHSETAVAAAMGVSRRRVGNIEAMLRPPGGAVERFLRALEQVDA
jgi:transcriptional regulator with XRE-family HTH domain